MRLDHLLSKEEEVEYCVSLLSYQEGTQVHLRASPSVASAPLIQTNPSVLREASFPHTDESVCALT